MPRNKIDKPAIAINDLKEANDILGQIAALKRDLTFVETCLNEDIDGLKAKAESQMLPVKAQIKELETALTAFATYSKTEFFKGRRSVELAYGIINWRKSTEIKPIAKHTFPMILGRVKALGLHEAIRIKEELNKDELHKWPAEKLELVGAKRVEKDVFGYELKQEDVAETA